MPTERTQICTLRLVYPPISNKEAELLRHDRQVQDKLRESNFYMIGSRAEAVFENPDIDRANNILGLEVVTGNGIRDRVQVHFRELPSVVGHWTGYIELEFGPKLFRLYRADQNGNGTTELLDWFTTEKLFHDFWRRTPGIRGLDRLRDFTTYELLYAGISKKENAFERLLNKPHDKRMRISLNEPQITEGARVADETYLFFFKAVVLRTHTFDFDSTISDEDLNPDLEDSRIVADAEKAFVNLIQSRYNTIKYKRYPKGTDSLFDAGLIRYCYTIGEDLTFYGPGDKIVGGFEPNLPASNSADVIFVEGENARLIKADEMAHAIAERYG